MKKVQASDIRAAVDTLKQGGVIALPTETTYGLACDPRNENAVKKIFDIKGRLEQKPLQLIASDFLQVNELALLTVQEELLAKKYWPGPLTMLVRLKSGVKLAKQVSPKSVIGIRVTSSVTAKAVARAFGHPIAATSANRSGSLPAFSGRGVIRAFQAFPIKPDFILDAGSIPRHAPSTVVRVQLHGEVEIMRQGSIRVKS